MEEQKILAKRIEFLCKEKNLSYYELSYKAAVPHYSEIGIRSIIPIL